MRPERPLADILPLTASALDTWARCPREYYDAHVLGLPESDAGPPAALGILLHRILELVHRDGSCADDVHVREHLDAHGLDDDGTIARMVAKHATRCPSGDGAGHHEVELARFHRIPPPMFMVTGRLDAVWRHRDLLDVRDYKTGRPSLERVAEDPRARLQAWLAAPVAARLGLQVQVRYEHLAAEVDEDPEPFVPDDDDLAAIDAELTTVAAAIVTASRAPEGFRGVRDPDVCRRCRYRSICPESAAPGEPTWPTPPER